MPKEIITNPAPASNCFKEAVCIDAQRIYDSCSDKDCLEDLRVYFTDAVQPLIDQAISVKCKDVDIINVFLEVEPVPFNRGFYSVDLTFFFAVKLDVYTSPISGHTCVEGLATFCKKVILFGSEGSVRVFASDRKSACSRGSIERSNLPKATVQVVDPICLGCRVCESDIYDAPIMFPSEVVEQFDGDFCCDRPNKTVAVTIGLFSIVQIERPVQMMIPVYDFCVPDKECTTTTDDPCELFKKIKFPINDFFPPRLTDLECE